ncbi:Flagellar hook protein FlgE [Rickettsiales bacterium Ac37b]|nr:Flagellar hook protein FlgE [Rickettsiales bacterium Ac37b]
MAYIPAYILESNKEQFVDNNQYIQITNWNLYLIIRREGFFLVRDKNNPEKILLTTDNLFSRDSSGVYINQNGLELLGHDSRKIFVPREIDQLEVVSIPKHISKATSFISIETNLNRATSDQGTSLYNATNPECNMASGKIAPHFSEDVLVYDEFGIDHNIRISFLKTETNVWQTEIYSLYPKELADPSNKFGQIDYGILMFNEYGTLSDPDKKIEIAWSNGSKSSQILLYLGHVMDRDNNGVYGMLTGITQLDHPSTMNYISNGYAPGELISVEMSLWQIIADYTNGCRILSYDLPVAKVNCSSCLVEYNKDTYEYIEESAEDLILEWPSYAWFEAILKGELEFHDINNFFEKF